jgi:hypothetical protein
LWRWGSSLKDDRFESFEDEGVGVCAFMIVGRRGLTFGSIEFLLNQPKKAKPARG